MEDYYFAAASHTGEFLRMVNGIRLNMEEDSPYINSGVMLMNLELLRREHSVIIHYCGRNKPWKEKYLGQLDVFYRETVSRMKDRISRKQEAAP